MTYRAHSAGRRERRKQVRHARARRYYVAWWSREEASRVAMEAARDLAKARGPLSLGMHDEMAGMMRQLSRRLTHFMYGPPPQFLTWEQRRRGETLPKRDGLQAWAP